MQDNHTAISNLIEAAKWISQQGWVPASGGSLSARTQNGFVITTNGCDKAQLTHEHFLQLDQQNLNTPQALSSEAKLHLS